MKSPLGLRALWDSFFILCKIPLLHYVTSPPLIRGTKLEAEMRGDFLFKNKI